MLNKDSHQQSSSEIKLKQDKNHRSVLRVIISGAAGKMGLAVTKAVFKEDDLKLVGVLDINRLGVDIGEVAGIGKVGVKISKDLSSIDADVFVDFTNPNVVEKNILSALDSKMHVVVGTTGLKSSQIEKIREKSLKCGKNVFIAPNFAIGAVLMIELAKKAAKYMQNAEIIELHHDQKADAPSGTALKTANELISKSVQIAEEKEVVSGARGGLQNNIRIHSVRLPGLVAHQEVIFGSQGQTLRIRHDSTDRASFMPGVITAIKAVCNMPGVTIGLEKVISV